MAPSRPRVLIYILRHDIRLSDNPIFHAASNGLLKNKKDTTSSQTKDLRYREDSFVSQYDTPAFTHLLPVYVFPANQIEVSGFIRDGTSKSPYPEARAQVSGAWRTGPHRAKFIAEGVWDLKQRLETLGSGLELRVGLIGEVVKQLLEGFDDDTSGSSEGADVAGVWMTSEDGTEEKYDEAEVKHLVEQKGVDFKVWEDEKYYIDERDLPFDNVAALSNVYTTFRKSLEPLRSRPRETLPTPERLPELPPDIPPQKYPFAIPNSLASLKEALLNPLKEDSMPMLSSPPRWPSHVQSAHPFSGGETAAQDRLSHLISSGAMSSYKDTRNGLLGEDFSTKLSAFLAHGHITARQIHWAMVDFEEGRGPGKGVEGYGKGENKGTAGVRFELLWRDYFHLVSRKFGPRIFHLNGIQEPPRQSRRNDDRDLAEQEEPRRPLKLWKFLDKSGGVGDDPEMTREVFARFCSGRTGVGLIDASNRELFLTGYTSNRARQNVASFLASHLGIDWRIGAEWYEYLLTDYDVANNWGNWQYVSGVGNDPRQGRIFNPVKQALDYDGQGEYIKAWVPELRGVQLMRSLGPSKKEVDQRKLMGLYQAWRLNDWEKERLGLRGLEWVEQPLVRIQFSVGRGKGHDGDGRGRGRGGKWRGKGRGQKRLGQEDHWRGGSDGVGAESVN